MSTVADILERAADLIEPEGAWTRGGSRTAGGFTTWSEDPQAISFCAIAAISRVSGGWTTEAATRACSALRHSLGLHHGEQLGGHWNDAPERTQAEVVAKLREAAAKAREQSS